MTVIDPVAEIERWLRDRNRFGATDYREQAEGLVATIRAVPAFRAALLEAPAKAPSAPVSAPEDVPGTSGHPDAAQAHQERRARWAQLLRDSPPWEPFEDLATACMVVADAELADLKAEVVALRFERDEAELDDERQRIGAFKNLRAEVDRLHSWDGLIELLDEHWPEGTWPTLADFPTRDTGPRIVSLLRMVDALRAEVTWERLAAETGAEKAAAEYEHQGELMEDQLRRGDERANRLTARLDEARATIARVKALVYGPGANDDDCLIFAIRAALDAPTVNPELTVPDGSGTWVGNAVHGPVHDPPMTTALAVERITALVEGNERVDRYEVDRLAAVKERIETATQAQERP